MKRRHKINWENVIKALDSIEGNAVAVEILRRELIPKYAAVVSKRAKARAAVYAYRATPEGKRKRAEHGREYGREYYAENRARCNAASALCHKRKRAAEKARNATTAE